MEGVVKLYQSEKHYGFVMNEGGEWFFHRNTVLCDVRELWPGVPVSFWLDDGARGWLCAVDVRVTSLVKT